MVGDSQPEQVIGDVLAGEGLDCERVVRAVSEHLGHLPETRQGVLGFGTDEPLRLGRSRSVFEAPAHILRENGTRAWLDSLPMTILICRVLSGWRGGYA